MATTANKVNVLGIELDVIDRTQLLSEIDRLASLGRPALLNYVNVHACNIACEDSEFLDILNGSDVVYCDGYGVKLGALLLGRLVGERMTPPDWIDELFVLCGERRYGVFFLGDTDAVASRFAQDTLARHPGLRVLGYANGFFPLHGKRDAELVNKIQQLRPDIILIGMGMPRQEKWAWETKQQLEKGVFIATGALFRWYTSYEKRAPRWITDNGFEWLARLLAAPRRHFKRYVVGLPLFFARILKQRLTAWASVAAAGPRDQSWRRRGED